MSIQADTPRSIMHVFIVSRADVFTMMEYYTKNFVRLIMQRYFWARDGLNCAFILVLTPCLYIS